MGRGRRPRPKNLHKKLRQIREALGITQELMATRLIQKGGETTTSSGAVADFETGKREPSLLVILAYSRIADISTDVLIDDRRNIT